MMNPREQLTVLRVTLAGTFLLSLAALYHFATPFYTTGILFKSPKWSLAVGVFGLGVFLLLGLLALSLTSLWRIVTQTLDDGFNFLKSLRLLNIFLFLLAIGLFSFLVLGRYERYLNTLYLRLLLFWLVVAAGSVFLKAAGLNRGWGELLAASLLFTTLGFKVASYIPDISNYPFSLSWSEASRYYYASLYFSKRIYGIAVPPTVLHPSRYLLQAVPFLISGSPLWFHRFWQAFLWVAITFVSALVLARRLSVTDPLKRCMLISWTFLFLLLGPVYYHLQIPVILVLLGLEKPEAEITRHSAKLRFAGSLAIVLLASAWAGISRVNWFPVPAMLAGTLFFLEEPTRKRPIWKYLLQPALWVVSGTVLAFASQALYALWSGNPTRQFTSSFTSDLLWYRLLPNPTYPLGILLAILIVSIPLFTIILICMAGRWKSYHPIRLLGPGAVLLILFAGGLLVSTKIGGGSNLHNLDAYLTILLVVSAYIYFDRFVEDQPLVDEREDYGQPLLLKNAQTVIFALILLLPAYFTIESASRISRPDREQTEKAINVISKYAQEAVQQGGEVLFISARELLTFQILQGIPLVPDYERVFLMEMAMAGDPEYLGRFHDDLQKHRFALIVSEPFFTQFKGSEYSFGEENDAWVEQVSKHVKCYYESERVLRGVRIQLLVPSREANTCP